MSAALPPLDAAQAAHAEQVLASLRERIRNEGPLRFDHYWDHVLYAPGLGYYAAGATKFGPGGDFVTAPELGPVFARCCADQVADVFRSLPAGGSAPSLLEFGAGSGAFAAAALVRLAELDSLPAEYRIVERSADLAARQRERIEREVPEHFDRVRWLDRLPETPWRGVVFANEVLDALAPRRLRFLGGGWEELLVGLDDSDALCWIGVPAGDDLAEAIDRITGHWTSAPPAPWVTEVQPAVAPWISGAVRSLEAGALLLSDYGYASGEYFHPERRDGTLICHFRHRAHDDPFSHPGLTDLSVSVDFGTAAEAIEAAGLVPAGCVSQATFLIATGLQREAEAALALPAAEQLGRMNEIKRLTLPGQMGDRFRFIAGVRGIEPALAGLPGDYWLRV